MTNLKTFAAASAMALLLATPAFAHEIEGDKDDGDHIEQSFDFTGFNKISVEGVYDVHITVGDDYSIETSGKPKFMKRMKVRMNGDTLILGSKKGSSWKGGKNDGIHAVITLPALNAVSLEGVGAVEATGIDADDFKISLEGVGSMEVAGRCRTLDASVEGIGSLEARDLKCDDVTVDVEGMGSAEVFAARSVNADMEGMGSIDVYGKPENVKKSKSFMSSVEIH